MQPNPEKEPSPFDISLPSSEDLETMPIEKLHAIWRENHEKIKEMLRNCNSPYFGLHGTSQENFKKIETSHKGDVEMATFYEKEYSSEQFLYKLYHAALYVSAYATKEQPGRIIVFNLEEDDKNMTLPWERLKSGNSLHFGLDCDSAKEKERLAALQEPSKENPRSQDLLYRTDFIFQDKRFDERFMGSIDFNTDEFKQLFLKLEDFGRRIIRYRFLAQKIVAETLRIVADYQKI
jgi:hypothetical protein